jgi:two-component system cell cycle sensor histidine kinase/response regulator CckA
MSAILVVEDETLLRDVLYDNLTDEGFAVLAAADADTALGVLAHNPIALMLTDIQMPGTSGIALTERALASHPHLKVVLMTGYAQDGIPEWVFERGIPVLSKPLNFDRIGAFLRQKLDDNVVPLRRNQA